ncbi:hypothetical protein EDC04DRAFT_2934164 [Pisolithus marmoratus]|nr:hypothetical protein EDC04DRAFT_2934164 [Pisolithus marmoratus]
MAISELLMNIVATRVSKIIYLTPGNGNSPHTTPNCTFTDLSNRSTSEGGSVASINAPGGDRSERGRLPSTSQESSRILAGTNTSHAARSPRRAPLLLGAASSFIKTFRRGVYDYPFHFNLPSNVPPTTKNEHGLLYSASLNASVKQNSSRSLLTLFIAACKEVEVVYSSSDDRARGNVANFGRHAVARGSPSTRRTSRAMITQFEYFSKHPPPTPDPRDTPLEYKKLSRAGRARFARVSCVDAKVDSEGGMQRNRKSNRLAPSNSCIVLADSGVVLSSVTKEAGFLCGGSRDWATMVPVMSILCIIIARASLKTDKEWPVQQSTRIYCNVAHALYTIICKGRCTTLYREVGLTTLQQATNQGCKFHTYQELKKVAQSYQPELSELPSYQAHGDWDSYLAQWVHSPMLQWTTIKDMYDLLATRRAQLNGPSRIARSNLRARDICIPEGSHRYKGNVEAGGLSIVL